MPSELRMPLFAQLVPLGAAQVAALEMKKVCFSAAVAPKRERQKWPDGLAAANWSSHARWHSMWQRAAWHCQWQAVAKFATGDLKGFSLAPSLLHRRMHLHRLPLCMQKSPKEARPLQCQGT